MSDHTGRLRWRCRRGMRELDAVLKAFLDLRYPRLNEAEKSAFASILELPDPDLYAYLAGRSEPADPIHARIIAGIRTSLHPDT